MYYDPISHHLAPAVANSPPKKKLMMKKKFFFSSDNFFSESQKLFYADIDPKFFILNERKMTDSIF